MADNDLVADVNKKNSSSEKAALQTKSEISRKQINKKSRFSQYKNQSLHAHKKKAKDGRQLVCAAPHQEQALLDFAAKNLSESGLRKIRDLLEIGWLRQENNHLHWLPDSQLPLENFKKIKTGLFLGQIKTTAHGQSRFEPAQAMALALTAADFKFTYAASADAPLIQAYLRGETLTWPENTPCDDCNDDRLPSAYGAVLVAGPEHSFPLGWVKHMTPPLLKNLYPQGWRNEA